MRVIKIKASVTVPKDFAGQAAALQSIANVQAIFADLRAACSISDKSKRTVSGAALKAFQANAAKARVAKAARQAA